MTAPEPAYEYGLCWEFRDGHTFIAPGYALEAAKLMADLCANPKEHNPHATGVVRRPVAEWLPVPLQPEGKTQATK